MGKAIFYGIILLLGIVLIVGIFSSSEKETITPAVLEHTGLEEGETEATTWKTVDGKYRDTTYIQTN